MSKTAMCLEVRDRYGGKTSAYENVQQSKQMWVPGLVRERWRELHLAATFKSTKGTGVVWGMGLFYKCLE